MLTRFHKILLGLLVIQVALAIFTTMRSGQAVPAKEKPLLAGYDAGKVTRLQVFANGATTPVDLVKKGDAWTVASAFNYPADASKVSEALSAIGRMEAAEPIATSAGHHRQLQVDDADFQRKLIVTADGKDLVVYLGGSAGPRRTAVRLDGPKVWAVSGISTYTYGTDARAWVDPAYVKVPREEVAKVTVQKGTSTIELDRDPTPAPPAAQPGEPPPPAPPVTFSVKLDGAAPTLAAGETIDTAAIDRMLDRATAIQLAAPADPNKAAASPTATITIEHQAAAGSTSTPAPTIIDVVADGDGYWVHERGSTKAAHVDKNNLDDLLNATRGTFVKAAPKPATATPPSPGAPTPPPDLPSDLQLDPSGP
ncbi:MAG TPA: DUF4340 domain-containing protein [Kofleriaceae bacterium]|nr:DUF4340 domain-containing protein [Kofleriaceae bacterium]